ncbi:hypothetical protein NDU88_004462 [Pleurodeles waltl]|uniref:Uncharacterized protein n=1 Tax=Pleurodeles waltl TaxID=8319 RepID=A0AAV7RJ83_PLEWA|nr:hypothetical protein NDU88_004462 [Pleurodeles waltl]
MGMPPDAWEPDFRVPGQKKTTDCREEEEEFSGGTPKTEREEFSGGTAKTEKGGTPCATKEETGRGSRTPRRPSKLRRGSVHFPPRYGPCYKDVDKPVFI